MVWILCFVTFGISAHADQYYSQIDQDKYLHENIFHNKKDGIFVDIGAHDGVVYSNTAFFERTLGWRGICIEPMPEIFEQLRRNRSCICINGCITDSCGIKDFLRIRSAYVNLEMLSGLLEKYDARHLARIDRELAKHGGTKEIIKVSCYTFQSIVEQHNIAHIDYLSIDTEGGELDILQTIDFDIIDLHIIDVENNYKDKRLETFLASKGFVLLTHWQYDDIYCNQLDAVNPESQGWREKKMLPKSDKVKDSSRKPI